jgi:hypothetical protein
MALAALLVALDLQLFLGPVTWLTAEFSKPNRKASGGSKPFRLDEYLSVADGISRFVGFAELVGARGCRFPDSPEFSIRNSRSVEHVGRNTYAKAGNSAELQDWPLSSP